MRSDGPRITKSRQRWSARGPRIEVTSMFPLHHVSSIPSMMEAVKVAAREAADREMPIGFFALTTEGWRTVTPRGGLSGSDLVAALAGCFDDLGVTLYGGVAEVWASIAANDDDTLRPSEAPDRMELVLAGAADRLGNKRLGIYPIFRGAGGRRRLGRWEEAPSRDVWWLKLIDPRRVVH